MSDFSKYSKEAMRIEYEKGYQQGQIHAFQNICGFMFGISISDDEALATAMKVKRALEEEMK